MAIAQEEYTRHYIVQALFKLMSAYEYEKIGDILSDCNFIVRLRVFHGGVHFFRRSVRPLRR